jgi:hypothetical protein
MKISLSTHIAMSPEEVWRRIQTPELLMHIAAPLVRFELIDPPGAVDFAKHDRVLVGLKLFGFLPLGKQWIVPSIHANAPDEWPKQLRDNGNSNLIRTWDHWITVEPDGQGGTCYRDEVEVKAGLLTPFVWAFAHAFYRHRQRRWRALANTQSGRTST